LTFWTAESSIGWEVYPGILPLSQSTEVYWTYGLKYFSGDEELLTPPPVNGSYRNVKTLQLISNLKV